MGDFLLNEALKRLATEAATRFSSLVASGDQIPFDVAEDAGPDSPFYRYLPLTARYVAEREGEMRSLPAFGPACDAVEEAGVAAPYLEARGEAVPAEPGERSARMLTSFIASLWDGSTEFSLDRARLDNALAVLDAEARDVHEADVLIVPIVGLRMAPARLQLPHGVRVVRAEQIDAPIEAMRSEGMGRAAWEPQFLALAEQSGEPGGVEEAVHQLRELISVMRLFKAGGVGLGPYAFAPTGEGRWRRVATGAPATRPGGYRLNEEEAGELAELASALEARPDPDGALAWAVGRFEMGCERESALEGLSDHLLALHAVLEGHGPVGASLPMRVSALISDESLDRVEARRQVERAMELERSLMNGAFVREGLGLASWIEEGVRRMLREAALGELGTDISTAADETLIATGLAAGDLEIAVTAQSIENPHMPAAEGEDMGGIDSGTSSGPDRHLILSGPDEVPSEEDYVEQETRIMEPIPEEDEIRITATPWLDEVAVDDSTLDFPAIESDLAHRERVDSPRVRHLFPVPDADWEVGELEYDHYRRHAG
ncbi:MAG TPA: hypothetical protein VNY83_09020 [Solirubrobacterales bacterium]|nr:hypothetical protein [Solirubrobacterales bacterium]